MTMASGFSDISFTLLGPGFRKRPSPGKALYARKKGPPDARRPFSGGLWLTPLVSDDPGGADGRRTARDGLTDTSKTSTESWEPD